MIEFNNSWDIKFLIPKYHSVGEGDWNFEEENQNFKKNGDGEEYQIVEHYKLSKSRFVKLRIKIFLDIQVNKSFHSSN